MPNCKLPKNLLNVVAASMLASQIADSHHVVLTIVWCGMSEICLKLKVLAKIDFIVFLACLTTGNLVWYCQSTKAKVTLWSVDLIEGLNCWNML